jgi:sigma-E factor negative regulatory protein RseA
MMKPAQHANAPADGERLSCLMDGELPPEEARALLAAVGGDEGLRSRWVAFHVVSDALRSHEVAASHSVSFCARVSQAVAVEPTVLAPRAAAASHSSLRRYLVPGLAVAASAAVIGFVAVPLLRPATVTAPQVAAAPTPAAAPVAVAALPDDGARRAAATVANARAMQAYLAAHRELASGAAMPRATPYLRASADMPEGR